MARKTALVTGASSGRADKLKALAERPRAEPRKAMPPNFLEEVR